MGGGSVPRALLTPCDMQRVCKQASRGKNVYPSFTDEEVEAQRSGRHLPKVTALVGGESELRPCLSVGPPPIPQVFRISIFV